MVVRKKLGKEKLMFLKIADSCIQLAYHFRKFNLVSMLNQKKADLQIHVYINKPDELVQTNI